MTEHPKHPEYENREAPRAGKKRCQSFEKNDQETGLCFLVVNNHGETLIKYNANWGSKAPLTPCHQRRRQTHLKQTRVRHQEASKRREIDATTSLADSNRRITAQVLPTRKEHGVGRVNNVHLHAPGGFALAHGRYSSPP
jgi:hypothetical protein